MERNSFFVSMQEKIGNPGKLFIRPPPAPLPLVPLGRGERSWTGAARLLGQETLAIWLGVQAGFTTDELVAIHEEP